MCSFYIHPHMYSVPLKKSLPISFTKSLGSFIQTAYQQDPANYADAMKDLDTLRQEAISSTACQESLGKLAAYLAQLARLPTRFPLDEDGIKVNFSWFNFAGKEKKSGKLNQLVDYFVMFSCVI